MIKYILGFILGLFIVALLHEIVCYMEDTERRLYMLEEYKKDSAGMLFAMNDVIKHLKRYEELNKKLEEQDESQDNH